MASTRFDMRLDEEIKAKAEKASALLGLKSLSEYIIKLIDEHATQVISEHESLTLKSDSFDRFMNACDMAQAPNKALQEALTFSKKNGMK